ncbi:MAG TPA: DUF3617 family protein [Allosphingosinicella sp.]|jgi:hypothetical protein|nr:DUF3617 family protein [Allosphingosinicella sp.]
MAATASDILGCVPPGRRYAGRMRWICLPLCCSLAAAATAGPAADAPLRPEKLRETMGLRLGSWKTRVRLTDLQFEPEFVGDPAKGQRTSAQWRTILGAEVTREQCLEDGPDRVSVPPSFPSTGCEYGRIEARNGRFAVALLCKDPESGETTTVALEGAYSPEKMTTRSVSTTFSGGTRIRTTLDLESRFAGGCESVRAVGTPRMHEGPPILVPPRKGN